MTTSRGYLRTPNLAGDVIAFVTEDDVWSVDATGGVARRLTDSLGQVARPVVSPNGEWLAFTSTDEHHAEVWVMPAGGGDARRLTWLGANTATRGWTPRGQVVFATDARQPFAGQTVLGSVRPTGGDVEFFPFGPATEVAWAPDGGVVLGRHTTDPARWKRYRGGMVGRLWIDRKADGKWKPLLADVDGNLAHPMWLDGRVWFLSDHEGIGNLYSCRPDGRDLERHTDHRTYYARFAATDGTRIVYQHAADLWLFDPSSGSSSMLDIDLRSPRAQRRRKFVEAGRYLSDASLHPKGHSAVVETRGKLFSLGLFEGAVHAVGQSERARYRLGRWLSETAIACVSDESGEDGLEVHTGDTVRTLDATGIGRVVDLEPSPDGTGLALTNHRHEVLVVDATNGGVRIIDRSDFGPIDGLCWSPDSAWLAYSAPTTPETRSIVLTRVVDGTTTRVTRPEFADYSPSWDPGGQYLYFLSARVFNPVGDTSAFAYGFPKGTRAYLLTLTATTTSPLLPDPRPLTAVPPKESPSAPSPVVIDLDGIDGRIVPIPLPESRYGQIVGLPGKVLVVSTPVEGILGRPLLEGPPANGSVDVWDLTEQRTERVGEGVRAVKVSGDGTTALYLAADRIRAVAAGAKPPEGDDAPGRKSGWLDLGRIRVSVDPGLEWAQMFDEAWRLQRDHFWLEDLAGVDWAGVRARYLPLVDRVATRIEFSDLMWEMQGELGTSHAYELGGDYRPPPAYVIGSLGLDLNRDRDGRWKVSHRVIGDPSDEAAASPASAPGVDLAEGDAIVAINGTAVGDHGTGPLLVHQAGAVVDVTVKSPGRKPPRTVRMQTVVDDRPARYRDWVAANRAFVRESSGGRCGYLHLPDMQGAGYAEFHRGWAAEVERDALVVDVRHNGGGNVSQLLLQKLAQPRLGYAVSRWHGTMAYPERSPSGPMVCLTDENAGSDGDIFSHCWKLLDLGPLVGKRTWGGVIGINPRHALADGSLTTQPEFSFWFVDVGWAVENYGTDPDHDVEIRPQDYEAGIDPQLDTATRLAVRALRSHKPDRPTMPRPKPTRRRAAR